MMTVDEAFEKAAAKIDALLAQNLSEAEIMLRDHGATEEELADFLARTQRDVAVWRTEKLAELRAWLERGGEHLQ